MAGFLSSPKSATRPPSASRPLECSQSYHHRVKTLKSLASSSSQPKSLLKVMTAFTRVFRDPSQPVHQLFDELTSPMHSNVIWVWINRARVQEKLDTVFDGLLTGLKPAEADRWRKSMEDAQYADGEYIAKQFGLIQTAALTGLYHLALRPFASAGTGSDGYQDTLIEFDRSTVESNVDESSEEVLEAARSLCAIIREVLGRIPEHQLKAVRVQFSISKDDVGHRADLDDPEASKAIAQHAFPPNVNLNALLSNLCDSGHIFRRKHTDVQVYVKHTNHKPHPDGRQCGGVWWEPSDATREFKDLEWTPTSDKHINQCETVYVVNKKSRYTIVVLTGDHKRGPHEVGKLLDLQRSEQLDEPVKNEYDQQRLIHYLHIRTGGTNVRLSDGWIQEYQCNVRAYPVQ